MWWYHRSSSPTGPLPKNLSACMRALVQTRMFEYVYACSYTCMYACLHVQSSSSRCRHVNAGVCFCLCLDLSACEHEGLLVNVQACLHAHVSTCLSAYMSVCLHAYVSTCLHMFNFSRTCTIVHACVCTSVRVCVCKYSTTPI